MPKVVKIADGKQGPKPKLDTIVGWADTSPWMANGKKFNPDDLAGRKGLSIYDKMMEDEQVKAVVRFKRDAITARGYYFSFDEETKLSKKEQKRRISLFEKILRQQRGAFTDSLNAIMSSMYHGFSITEKVFTQIEFEGAPYIGLKQLVARPVNTFYFEADEYGNTIALWQEVSGRKQKLPLDAFIHSVHNPENDEHYGRSELREAYRAWYSKSVVIKYWLQFLERFGGGFVVCERDGDNGPIYGSQEFVDLQNAMNNIRTIASIVLPQGIKMTVHNPQTTDQYQLAIEMFNLAIAKALLVPNLLGVTETGQTGSYAQSQTQLEGFMWTLNADSARLEDTLNEQLFKQLGEFNFADGEFPSFRFKPLSAELTNTVITTWKDLVGAKMVSHSENDEDALRKMMNMPAKQEGAMPISDAPPGQMPKPGDEIKPEPAAFSREKTSALAVVALSRVSLSVLERQMDDIESSGVAHVAEAVARITAKIGERVPEMLADIEQIGLLQVDRGDVGKVKAAIKRSLEDGWRIGGRHAQDEIGKSRKDPVRYRMSRIEDIASQFFEANSFRMAGNVTERMRDLVQASLQNGVKLNWSTQQILEDIYSKMVDRGLTSARAMTTMSPSEIASKLINVEDMNAAYALEAMIRTNVAEAINEARYSYFTDPELDGFVVALEYSSILDQRTTELCRHMDGRIYADNSPVWNTHRPPNHYNCRSILVAITKADGWDGKESEPPKVLPSDGFGTIGAKA